MLPDSSPLPERFKLQREDGALELSWSWKQQPVLALLPVVLFFCCCPMPCGLYGQALVEGTVEYKPNNVFAGYLKIPWLGYLLIAGAVLFSVAFLLLSLGTLVNRTTLRAERGWLRLSHRPIPIPKTELHADDLVGFEPSFSTPVSRRSERKKLPPAAGPGEEYRLDVVHRNGTRYRVVSDLETLEQCAWVERELRRALGMSEAPP